MLVGCSKLRTIIYEYMLKLFVLTLFLLSKKKNIGPLKKIYIYVYILLPGDYKLVYGVIPPYINKN